MICVKGFESPWGYVTRGQDRGFYRVLAFFVSIVVYTNLLVSVSFVQAGGQDKIAEVWQEANSLLFCIIKSSGIDIESQSGVRMTRQFLDNLRGSIAVGKERNVGIA